MSITIDSLLTPVTTEVQLEIFMVQLEALGLSPRSWRAGGALRVILRIVASAYVGFQSTILEFAKAGFLETSSLGWLTLLAYYVYGVTRIEATYATGQVRLVNAGGGIYTIQPGELRCVSAVTGKSFKNVALVSLVAGATILIDVIATEPGASGSATPGTVTILETVLPSVTVTNLAAIVGRDAEVDADLRQRCKDRLGTISGLGPRGAYAFAVRSAVRTDGSPVDVNRIRISPSSSTGIVTIYVASPSGAPTPSDLPFISASIESYARPDTVTVDLQGAVTVPLTAALTVWAKRTDGLTAGGLNQLVSSALLAMITDYPVGGIAKPPSLQGYLYADGIAGTVKSAHPAIFDVDGAGADIALAANEVATLATTLDIRIVSVT